MNGSRILDYCSSTFWALHEEVLNNLAMIVTRHVDGVKLAEDEIKAAIEASAPGGVRQSAGYQVFDGVAVIPIFGIIAKHSHMINGLSQPRGTSTMAVQRDIERAINDPDVNAILLQVESPGGSIDGVAALADQIYDARKKKKIFAYADDLAASAAYWIAAQAEQVFASKAARVGSIGVYTVAIDYSRHAENLGLRVNVVKAGAMKGAGVAGAPITNEQLSEVQRNINAIYDLFVTAVAIGRGMDESKARVLADGRVHIGESARTEGLVDGIDTFDGVLKRLRASSKNQSPRGGLNTNGKGGMSMDGKEKTEGGVNEIARMKALKEAFPNHLAFATEQFVKGHDVEKAKAEFADVLAKENEALKSQVAAKDEELKKKGAQQPKKAGVEPLGGGTASEGAEGEGKSDGSAKETFMSKVDELIAKGNTRAEAVSKVSAKHPDLHRAWLEEVNGASAVEAVEGSIKDKRWI